MMPDPLHESRLGFRRLGAIGGTGALALAGVLAPVLLVSAALALAIVLPFAGVLWELLPFRRNHHAGYCRGVCRSLGAARSRLGVQTGGGAAKEASKCRGQSEFAYSI